MRASLFIFFILFVQISFSQKNWELVGDDLIVDGKKICSIVEEKNRKDYNRPLTDYVIKDVNGVTRMYVGYPDQFLYFSDDERSFVSDYLKGGLFTSKRKSIAAGLAAEELFTSSGYNEKAKLKFIQNNVGVWFDGKTGPPLNLENRDKTKEVRVTRNLIVQDGYIIGRVYQAKVVNTVWFHEYNNMYGLEVADVRSSHAGSGSMESTIHPGKDISEKFKEEVKDYSLDGTPTHLSAAKWLNGKGLFDLKSKVESGTNQTSPTPTEVKNATTPVNSNSSAPVVSNKNNPSTPVENKTASTSPVTNTVPSGFTTYSTKSSEKLETMKKDAVAKNDFDAAAAIKTELDLRKAEQEKVANFQKDLDEKVKAEDYAGASKLQKEIGPLKEKIAKKDQLRKDIDAAVAGQDYEKAEKLKQELKTLY